MNTTTPAQGTTPLYSVKGLDSVFGKSGKKRFAAGILVTGYECERQRLMAEADTLRAELAEASAKLGVTAQIATWVDIDAYAAENKKLRAELAEMQAALDLAKAMLDKAWEPLEDSDA